MCETHSCTFFSQPRGFLKEVIHSGCDSGSLAGSGRDREGQAGVGEGRRGQCLGHSQHGGIRPKCCSSSCKGMFLWLVLFLLPQRAIPTMAGRQGAGCQLCLGKRCIPVPFLVKNGKAPLDFQLCLRCTAQFCDYVAEGGIFAFIHPATHSPNYRRMMQNPRKGSLHAFLKINSKLQKFPFLRMWVLTLQSKLQCTLNNVQSPAEASVAKLYFILFLTQPCTYFTNLNFFIDPLKFFSAVWCFSLSITLVLFFVSALAQVQSAFLCLQNAMQDGSYASLWNRAKRRSKEGNKWIFHCVTPFTGSSLQSNT